jgi:hypothetical protein
MELIGCPETSVRHYHYPLRNNPEERSSHLLRGGSLKSRRDVPIHAIQEQRRSKSTAPVILNVGTICEWVVNFRTRLLETRGKSLQHALNTRLGGPQSLSETLSYSLLTYRLCNSDSQGNHGNEVNHPNHKNNGNQDKQKINGNFSIHGKYRDNDNFGTKMLIKLVPLHIKRNVSTKISHNIQHQFSLKIHPVGVELFHEDRRTGDESKGWVSQFLCVGA